MFIIFLRKTNSKPIATDIMQEHGKWLSEGFDAGVFLLAGTIVPREGGAILATNTSRKALDLRLAADPFVERGIVSVSIVEVEPARAHETLSALIGS